MGNTALSYCTLHTSKRKYTVIDAQGRHCGCTTHLLYSAVRCLACREYASLGSGSVYRRVGHCAYLFHFEA
jgi:hypothetical protein